MAIDITKLGGGIAPAATLGLGGAGTDAATDIQGTGFVGQDFGTMLKQAVGALGELSGTADANALKMATGGQIDIQEVMLSMENASLGFQTALQVRNKLVDAYQEIMRMSV